MRHAVMLGAGMLLAALLSGCGGPSPTRLTITMNASPQLNPNSDNQPSPTVVRIYDLKSADNFNSATFNDLFYNDTAKLGGDMLGRKEVEMLPGKSTIIKRDAETGTKYLGVIAGFRTLLGTSWRSSLPVKPEEQNPLIVTLGPNVITVAKKPSSGFLGIF
jgi:type VI secretion system protein VasD